MRQTLFYIPHELLGLPVFGFGWLLMAWVLFTAIFFGWLVSRRRFDNEARGLLPILLLVAAVIVFLLPRMEILAPGGAILGFPLRGFGVMLLIALIAGLAMTVYLGRSVGIDADTIYAMSFWMCIAGIVTARIFYVTEYWHVFRQPSLTATLWEILKFTEGGIIVYGSFTGAMIAFLVFTTIRRLPALLLADVIAPGMMLGLAIGRIGCLLNGCCYGGIAAHGPFSISFPQFSSAEMGMLSPPYLHQLQSGQLHGIRVGEEQSIPVVKEVRRGSQAELAGLNPGVRITAINGRMVSTLADAQMAITGAGPRIAITSSEGKVYRWSVGEMPTKSLPVHPTQLYSSLNAALLCLLLLSFFPFRARDGQVFALMLTLYPVTRFLLEMLRDDEPGQLGTVLTVSQILSVVAVVFAAVMWLCLARQPRRIFQPSPRR